MSRVSHANLVRYMEIGRGPDGNPFALMEHLWGRTLGDVLAKEGPLRILPLLACLKQLAEGIDAAHRARVFLGGVDPGGVFISGWDPSREDEIGDFHATILDRRAGPLQAPGLVNPGRAAVVADIHSLGLLAYEALSGHAFISPAESGGRGLALPGFLGSGAAVPPALEDFVLRLMSQDPDRVPGNAHEVAARASALLTQTRRKKGGGTKHRDTGKNILGSAVSRWSIRDPEPVIPRDPVFIERPREAALINSVLSEAIGDRGTFLWLEGLAGIGKTMLGRSFLEAAERRGFHGIEATGGTSSLGLAFAALDEALRGRNQGRGSLAVFLDDYHRLSAAEATALEGFLRAIQARAKPIVMLVSSRPLAPTPSGASEALHRTLAFARDRGGIHNIPRLSDRDVDLLVESMSPVPCDLDTRAAIRRVSAGNPWFVVEFFRHLAETGALFILDDRICMVPGAMGSLPESLKAVLAERTTELESRCTLGSLSCEILTRVVLLDPWTSGLLLETFVGLEERPDLAEALPQALDLLVREEFIRRVPWRNGERLVPVHPFMLPLLLEGKDPAIVARLHWIAAHVLENTHAPNLDRVAADLANHALQAGHLDRSADHFLAAGRQARQEGRNREAREYWMKATRLLSEIAVPGESRLGRVWLDLCEVCWFLGEYAEAREFLHRVEAEPTTDRERDLVLLDVRARLNQEQQEEPEALDLLGRLSREAIPMGRGDLAVIAMCREACIKSDRGEGVAGSRLLDEAEKVPGVEKNSRIQGLLALSRARVIRRTVAWRESLELLDRALALLTGPGDIPERSDALFLKGIHLADLDRPDEVVAIGRIGVSLCEQSGYLKGLADHLTSLGIALVRSGEDEEGRDLVRRAMAIRERLGNEKELGHVLAAMAELALARKDWSTARDLAGKALALSRAAGDVQGEQDVLLLLARAHLGRNDLVEGERSLEACLLSAGGSGCMSAGIAMAHLLLADLRDGNGDGDAALRHRMNAIVMLERLDLEERAEGIRKMIRGPTGSWRPVLVPNDVEPIASTGTAELPRP